MSEFLRLKNAPFFGDAANAMLEAVYYRLEEERQRKMGIEQTERADSEDRGMWKPATPFDWGAEDNHWRYDYRPATTVEDRIDWGLLDEFLVLGRSGSGLWLQHSACRKPTGMARTNLSVADLVLAVEEHMKECGK